MTVRQAGPSNAAIQAVLICIYKSSVWNCRIKNSAETKQASKLRERMRIIRMKKKLAMKVCALALTAAMIGTMAGCGNDSGNTGSSGSGSSEDSQSSSASSDTASDAQDESGEESSDDATPLKARQLTARKPMTAAAQPSRSAAHTGLT